MSQLIGPVIGSSLLMVGIYVPYYFSIPVAIFQIPLVLCLPAGKQSHTTNKQPDTAEQDPLLVPEPALEGEGEALLNVRRTINMSKARTASRKELWKTIKEDSRRFFMMFRSHNIVIYAHATCLVITLGKQALHILLQYVSKRFGITLAQVNDAFLRETGYL